MRQGAWRVQQGCTRQGAYHRVRLLTIFGFWSGCKRAAWVCGALRRGMFGIHNVFVRVHIRMTW
jgi:hypothetical protein